MTFTLSLGIRRALAAAGCAILVANLAACMFTRVGVHALSPDGLPGSTISSPVKIHMRDGSTIVYTRGISVDSRAVRGDGRRFAIDLTESAATAPVPIDSIAAAEGFITTVNGAPSAVANGLIAAGALGAMVAVSVVYVVLHSIPGAGR